jgi:hypothetical protein
MELYSGPHMVNEKYLKTKYLRSKNRDSTVFPFDWIDLAQDRDRWRALVNVAMNIQVP